MRHLFPSDRIAGLLDADRGFTAVEVEERRYRYCTNDILGDKRAGWSAVARDTAQDPMVWLLVVTALLFAWLGDYAEASILGLALLPIAGMDAYLHRCTQATTEGLAGRLATSARVLRDGAIKDVPSVELVPGDLVVVEEGSVFPADGLIMAGVDLQADESTLTGEAMPVRKHAFHGSLQDGETSVGNDYWGAAGTRLLTGSALRGSGARGRQGCRLQGPESRHQGHYGDR